MHRLLTRLLLVAWLPVASACETSEPTEAVIDNAYSASDARGNVTVYAGWWSVAAFFDPVPAGAESAPVRVVKGTAPAYLLLARAWDPAESAPAALVPVRTRSALTVERGDTLHIRVAPETVDGDCATGAPLSQDDADFITQRIFPGAFSNEVYDAATCTSSPAGDGSGGAPSGAAGDAAGASAGDRSGP
jgi:hypothetical protein